LKGCSKWRGLVEVAAPFGGPLSALSGFTDPDHNWIGLLQLNHPTKPPPTTHANPHTPQKTNTNTT
jgi:hypothetical protein